MDKLEEKINTGIRQLNSVDANPIFVSQVMSRIEKEENSNFFKSITLWAPQISGLLASLFILAIIPKETNLGNDNQEQFYVFQSEEIFEQESTDYSDLLELENIS